jgi:glycerol-3-phosphate dehydrogenase (NAD(P)+)
LSEAAIAVIGAGAWGSALALHLGRAGQPVRLWMHEAELVERFRERRDNPLFLPGYHFPESVSADSSLKSVLNGADLILGSVPSPYARAVYRRMAPYLADGVPFITATKGIEEESLALPLDAAREELGSDRPVAVLSGPSFARELAEGLPTVVALASTDDELAREAQHRLAHGNFRLYRNDDPTGVQVAAALKNVMAIAAGVADSLHMGSNGQAALITRGLAEMARLGTKLGGRLETFSGLAGLGDLVLTCSGRLSRNRQVGQRLGRGERLADILSSTPSVPEGVRTTASAHALAAREEVEMPIVGEVHRVLYEDGDAEAALTRLMTRPLRAEHPVDPRS